MTTTNHSSAEPSTVPLVHADVLRVLHYNPQTGAFTWRVYRSWRAKAGSRAGNTKARGYVEINCCGWRVYAHRLAWFYMTGEWPPYQIDHIDRSPANNSWANLRLATHSQNQQNHGVSRASRSGYKGVFPQHNGRGHTGKWRSQIKLNGRTVSLGAFPTPELAHRAYAAAAEKHRGEFGRA